MHVLVVDDDDDVRETLELILESEGFRVSVASDGRQALERLSGSDAPDVMLLDLRMPVMTGWDVVDALRQNGGAPRLPIVICTSSPDESPQGLPVVPKPVKLDALLATLRRAGSPSTDE
jgi:CheY-like chemotaxis protein